MTIQITHIASHPTPGSYDFGDFFGGWLVKNHGQTLVIDTGVGSGSAGFIANLKAARAIKVDWVLITHIHLDHAGSLAAVLEAYPEAKGLVHEKGLRHMATPEKLWASTKEVVAQERAEIYGQPRPIDPGRLAPHSQANIDGVEIIETPGHAQHHLCFDVAGHLFAGEAGGTPYWHNGQTFSRPATPPKYLPDVTRASIHKLLARPDGPAYFAHEPKALPLHETLHKYMAQLDLWAEFIESPQAAIKPGESDQGRMDRLAWALLNLDDNFAPRRILDGTNLIEELNCLKLSLSGILDYHESR